MKARNKSMQSACNNILAALELSRQRNFLAEACCRIAEVLLKRAIVTQAVIENLKAEHNECDKRLAQDELYLKLLMDTVKRYKRNDGGMTDVTNS